jgi:hypothetical protein
MVMTTQEKLRAANQFRHKNSNVNNDIANIYLINVGGDEFDNRKPVFKVKHSSDGNGNGMSKSQVNKTITALNQAQAFADRLNK